MDAAVLLINPWITDVAAYDLWAKPLGLLYWAAWLRGWGFEIALIDCLDRGHPSLGDAAPKSTWSNTGKYRRERFDPQPEIPARFGLPFNRHGISPAAFEAELEAFERRFGGPPGAVVVGSRMTYWSHGVADSIARCRARWGSAAPIALGGIYATLLPGHARRHSGADIVFEGQAFESFPRWLRERFPARAAAIHAVPENLDSWPRPAVDLCHGRKALPLLMSLGCPGRCAYCASALLAPRRLRRSAESAHAELADHAERFGAEDIAFFDDALLTESARWFEPFLDRVIAQGPRVRFHAPNGLNCAEIHPGLAGKMKAAGFETVRLSLETIATERLREWRRSGGAEAFARAVVALRRAGFRRDQIGAYIMGGMPGQTSEETRRTIEFAHDAGATPYLNEFSPIPETLGMERAIAQADMRRPGSGRELIEEPLWQNNSLYFLRGDSYPAEEFIELKRLTRRLRSAEPVGKALASGGANAVFLPAAPHGDFRQAADRPFFQEDC